MTTPAQALERLKQPQNKPLRWLLSEALHARSQQAEWNRCRILQQLAEGSVAAEQAWNGLIDRARKALGDPAGAQARAAALLGNPPAQFDGKLDDLVAELISVVYLSKKGFSQLQFCAPQEQPMPDLSGVRDGREAFIEVKNLREPPSLTIVAFSRWHANKIRDANRFNFEVLVEYDGIEPELNQVQREAVEGLIDLLPDRERPTTFTETLPGGVRIRFSLNDGAGVMMTHGPGGALDPVRIRSSQSLVYKLMAPAAKALSQLYSPMVPSGSLRVMVLRWKVPDDIWLVEEEVRTQVGIAIQGFMGSFFPELEVYLISSLQDI